MINFTVCISTKAQEAEQEAAIAPMSLKFQHQARSRIVVQQKSISNHSILLTMDYHGQEEKSKSKPYSLGKGRSMLCLLIFIYKYKCAIVLQQGHQRYLQATIRPQLSPTRTHKEEGLQVGGRVDLSRDRSPNEGRVLQKIQITF